MILEVGELGKVSVFVKFNMEGKVATKFGMAFPETDSFELKNFRAKWNQKSIKVSKKWAGKNQEFRIGSLHLPAIFKFSVPASNGDRHSLITNYEYTGQNLLGTKSPPGYYVEYILQTGATWDNQIDEVLFLIRGKGFSCKDVYVLEDSFQGNCNGKGEYEVLLENIEPKKDFRYILQASHALETSRP